MTDDMELRVKALHYATLLATTMLESKTLQAGHPVTDATIIGAARVYYGFLAEKEGLK